MLDDWTAEVVGRMHTARITGQMLAEKCGYSAAYLSTVLNGRKGNNQTKQNIFDALIALENESQTKQNIFDALIALENESQTTGDVSEASDG